MTKIKAPNLNLSPHILAKITHYALWISFAGLGFLFITELGFSMAWRMEHDTPLLHYVAFLINEHDYVPYRDVFETSMPGSILFHMAIGKGLGYQDLAIRIVDVVYLLLLMVVSGAYLRRFGSLAAILAPLCFAIFYLSYGPLMSLQRDYLGLLPIAVAIWISLRFQSQKFHLVLVNGALFGIAALFKPHLLLGLPLITTYQSYQYQMALHEVINKGLWVRHAILCFLLALGGAIVVVAIPLLWLWIIGAWPAFWSMVWDYLPLHIQLTVNHSILAPGERFSYLLGTYIKFGGYSLLCVPILLVLILFWRKEISLPRAPTLLMLSLTLLYSVYPIFSGQFWNYHWMPFYYFAFMCLGIAASVLQPAFSKSSVVDVPITQKHYAVMLVVIFVLSLTLKVTPTLGRQLQGQALTPPENGRVDQIAQWLSNALAPGEKIQVMDWTSGAVHALLEAHVPIATRFIYDYHFYHHVSNPYIIQLRQEFVQALSIAAPRYILIVTDKHKPRGWDTSTGFPQLQEYLKQNYQITASQNGYVILSRKVM